MENMPGRFWILPIALVLGCSAPALSVPLTFDLAGVNDPTLSAHVVFAYAPGTGTVEIDITNTSALAAGPDPRFTAFAFNVPANVTGVSSFAGPSGWDDLFSLDGIDTPGQFGQFDVAGITGVNFAGGFPNDGIPRGSTFSFTIVLTGIGLGGLDESSFLSLLSDDPAGPPSETEQYFIGRFQRTGAGGGGSDVAIPTLPAQPIPEPAYILLLGAGLSGLWWSRRKRI